jgi:cobalt-zinc-cadmium efflux system outer membrane protein
MEKLKHCLSILLWLCVSIYGKAQQPSLRADTLHLTLNQAENAFIQNNLQLLAQRYNIDAAKALTIQARLWPNPNLSIDRGPLFPLSNPAANFFNNSETGATLSQLFLLAGKRNKQIKLAEASVKLTEFQFYDLLRTLKYTLRTDFYNIYYLQQSAKLYDEEISSLQQVANAFAKQEGKGYIAEKEVVRIKAQLYSLQSEYNDLVNQINDTESELKLVLQVKSQTYLVPLADTIAIASLNPQKYTITELLDTAYKSRTDLQIARTNTDISKLNYNYQKSLATPDLTLSLSYDKQGSYVQNFHSLGVSMDLPFLNRNQGNIKSAKSLIEFNNANQKFVEATVEENTFRALQKVITQDKMYRTIDPGFSADFERLLQQVVINYQRRNIGLLEFLDFYDSYKLNTLQINSIKFNRVSAFEDLNFYTGSSLFN